MASEDDLSQSVHRGGFFPTTHWSVVLLAGQGADTQARAALARLCEYYRAPVLAYARGLGLRAEDAEDFTQSFYAHFIAKNLPGRVERQTSVKFRSFLLRCFKNFLSHERERQNAKRRGGGQPVESLDAPQLPGGPPAFEPADELTAERQYERAWASSLLERVLSRLETDYRERDKAQLFGRLQPFLLDRQTGVKHGELADQLGLSEPAVRKEVSRMRQRYRELFRNEIAQTVSSPIEIDAEMRHLFAVICG